MTRSTEHVFLFGIEVESTKPITRATARQFAYGILEVGSEGAEENNEGMTPSWWHAENDRADGSDRDSVTFVPFHPVRPADRPEYAYVSGEWLHAEDDSETSVFEDDVESRPRAYWARITGYAAGGLLCTVSRGVAEIFARDHQRLHEINGTYDGVVLQGNLMLAYRTEESGGDPGVEEIRANIDGTFGLPGWTWFAIDDDDLDHYLLVG